MRAVDLAWMLRIGLSRNLVIDDAIHRSQCVCRWGKRRMHVSEMNS